MEDSRPLPATKKAAWRQPTTKGIVAPCLYDIFMSTELALADHVVVMKYVMRMLCAGSVHGDLPEFNVLVDD